MTSRLATTVCAITLFCIFAVPASAKTGPSPLVPNALALPVSQWPSGAVIVTRHTDHSAASINAEGILGTKSRNGTLYQRLHARGSLFEAALLPRFRGYARHAWLMATIFPSTSAATQAYKSDSEFSSCDDSPTVSLSIPMQTCTYMSTQFDESGMYVVGVSHNVEFIVLAFVETGSSAARTRATRDATFVAQGEASVVQHLFGQRTSGRSNSPKGLPSPTAVLVRPSATAAPLTATPPPPTMTPIPTPTDTPTPAPTDTSTSTSIANVGDSVDVPMSSSTWRIQVTSVKALSTVQDSTDTYTAQGKYIMVFMTVTNVGTKPANFYLDQNLVILDSQGRQFSHADSFADTTADNEFNVDDSFTTVQPSFTIHTALLFDIASDANGLILANTDILGDNPQNLFNLGM